jgi:hypothetical protein
MIFADADGSREATWSNQLRETKSDAKPTQ